MKYTNHILTLLFLLLVGEASGQDISVDADYPGVVRSGQQFAVSWTINTGGGEFEEPEFEGFYKLMGPQTSYSSSTQIINGKVTRSTTYTYTYYLQALNEGKYAIAPAKFTLKNKSYYSDSLRIEVVGSGSAGSQGAAGAGTGSGDLGTVDTSEDLFVNLILDKSEVFMGEHISATVKIYSRVDISGINEIKFPGFEGFLRTDLETPPLTSLRRETINGRIYGTGVVQQFLLYPQLTGEISIDPVQISVLVQQKSGQSDPFFGDFFQTYTTVPRALVSRSLKVRVKPLPGTKPDNFSGIVGKASVTASLDKDTVSVNDALNLKIVLSGSGNLKLANFPAFKLPADIEMYDPKITDNLKNTVNGTSGQKIFEYLLIPRHHGDFTIPSFSYPYFDLTTRRYENIVIPELRFHAVKGDDQNAGITVYGGVSKEDVKYLGRDIRFIRSEPGLLRRSGSLITSKRSFYSAYAIALIVFLAVLVVRREHIRRNSDIASVKTRKAGKIASRRLKEAGKCLKEKQTDRFYEEILKALWGYLSDKLNIPVSELNRTSAVKSLTEKGIGEEDVNTLASVIDTCEYARYAPSSSPSEAEKVFEDASRFIRLVENSIG
ncbi:MAG TPA: BatD family protein [Bacteroidales bacterium]|nr:BatD family protein [Bacteroidales bacterium]